MRLCVVPMKPLAKAKQRLSDVFTADERRVLSLAMLTDVVTASIGGFYETWVICSDQEAADVARAAGARAVPDRTPADGLNASLAAATTEAIEAGATGMLVVSADCPSVTPADLRALALGPGIAIAPDRTGTGTNALWRQPCDVIPASFGRMSRRAHQGHAYAGRIPLARVPREALGVDVDRPRDLDRAIAIGVGMHTAEALRSLGYPRE